MAYNALIREYSGKSLKVVGRVLITNLSDIPTDWKVRYRSKDVDRATTEIGDMLCCRLNPLQIYKPVTNSFPLTVRTMDGKYLEVVASEKDTVGVLKLKIFQKCDDYFPDIQELHVNRRDADVILYFDWMRLEMFDINRQACTVYLKLKLKVAEAHQNLVHFKAVNVDTLYIKSMGQICSPWWTKYAAGMNFPGICANPECVSKEFGVEREVVSRAEQYGEIRLNLEGSGQRSLFQCPACLEAARERLSFDNLISLEEEQNFPMVPNRCTVKNARALLFFKGRGDTRIWRGLYQSKGKDAGDFKEFRLNDKEIVEITTVEPWRSPFCCVKCDTRIVYKAHENVLECGHVFHVWCTPSVLRGRKCKICQAETAELEKYI